MNESKKCYKNEYRKLCQTEQTLSIFQQDWWLDTVCGEENWDVVLYKRGETILGAWPYYFQYAGSKMRIIMPQLTQSIGVWVKNTDAKKYEKKLSREIEILNGLIKEFEKLPILSCEFHNNVNLTNWLPFYWKKFSQTTYYTYRINDIKNIERIESEFSSMKKKNIKKAIRENIQIFFDLSAEEFYNNHVMTLRKQGKNISYDFDFFKKIYEVTYKHNAGRTIYAKDINGNLQGALFVIWDSECAYDLISTLDPDYRNSGASSLLVYEIIKYLSQVECGVNTFDFEGSMIPGVEESFRKFGAKQTPYFRIWKNYGSRIRYTV